jgi:hypothetical protein
MENAEFHLIQPVDGLQTLQQTTVDRRKRRDKNKQNKKQSTQQDETTKDKTPMEMTEPDILDEAWQGDDPHAIDYRA